MTDEIKANNISIIKTTKTNVIVTFFFSLPALTDALAALAPCFSDSRLFFDDCLWSLGGRDGWQVMRWKPGEQQPNRI